MIVEKFGSDAADAVNILSNASCTLEGSAKQVAGEPFHCISFSSLTILPKTLTKWSTCSSSTCSSVFSRTVALISSLTWFDKCRVM